jgi:hypothetical protein
MMRTFFWCFAFTVDVFALHQAYQTAPLFSCGLPEATIFEVETDLSYSYSVNGKRWLEDGDVAAQFDSRYASASAKTLIPNTPELKTGSDLFGAFFSLSVNWTSSIVPYSLISVFKCYNSSEQLYPHVAFQTVFPSGASGPIGTANEDSPAGAPNGYNYSAAPITHFPSWSANSSSFINSGALSHIEWAGCVIQRLCSIDN